MNLQRHRIAQCRSVVIRILGNEGVPVQVDGEAWVHPPGIIRILHKNRVQLICRDRVQFCRGFVWGNFKHLFSLDDGATSEVGLQF